MRLYSIETLPALRRYPFEAAAPLLNREARLTADLEAVELTPSEARSLEQLLRDAAIVARAAPDRGAVVVDAARNRVFPAAAIADVLEDWMSRYGRRVLSLQYGQTRHRIWLDSEAA
jgi:hypothetical protein